MDRPTPPSRLLLVLALAAGGALGWLAARGADGERARLRLERDLAVQAREDVLALAWGEELARLLREVDELWPADERMLPRYERWLTDAYALAGRLPELRAKLQAVRARANPVDEAEAARQRLAHPRVRELADWRERAAAVGQELARLEAQPARGALEEATRRSLREEQAKAAARVAALEAETASLWTGSFDTLPERWYHARLTELVEALHAFVDPSTGELEGLSEEHGWGVRRRHDWVREVREQSLDSPDAAARWREACAAIADVERAPAYGGLALEPQLGLLPLGPDPISGLWEFAQLATGRAPERDPATGALRFDRECGLVLVLLPGGRFRMGAQSTQPEGERHDPLAADDESPVHEVELAPYFLSKYEMTQAQWERVAGRNPSDYRARTGEPHPVETIYWSSAFSVLWRLGLDLPTEAQWEYAARAGTDGAWWTGDERESLVGAANLADAAALRSGASWDALSEWPEHDDGYVYHAPVNSFRPNAFGLHHMAGNVWEWCRDWYGRYELPLTPKDGERIVAGRVIGEGRQYGGVPFPADGRVDARLVEGARAVRGGGFNTGPSWCRSAARGHRPIAIARGSIGLRPARPID